MDDFHRSGGQDLNAFLLQDLQGALFFHQILSAVIGAVWACRVKSMVQRSSERLPLQTS